MTATTLAARPDTRLSAIGIVRSEWIKLRSVRSTVWSYAIVVAASIGIAALLASSFGFGEPVPDPTRNNLNIVQTATFGLYIGQLVVAVLGVLVISGEYSTGMIRSTLTAVPKRLPALAAKAVVLFVTTFVVGLISVFAALLVALPILSGFDITADFSDSSLLGNLVLAALYLGLVALFALGLGTVLRSSAGGIAAALGVILLLPTILQLIAGLTQAQWALDLMPYLFSNAGTGMFTESFDPNGLEQWQNTLVVVAWVAVSLIAGAVLLKRRDA
ncbi:ABC transporter permease subunit [Conyzicola sp.]|uniref:ABC transporter permease subunit n=1 Tax=Conyzicola sp. TaxID=1969404 RepID=UPI0039891B4D